MIEKTDKRIVKLMIEKIERLEDIIKNHNEIEIKTNYIYSDSIQYEFEKLYEDSTRLSPEFLITHKEFPIDKLRAIRNRVAHDYESVIIDILLDVIKNDFPYLKSELYNAL